MSEVSGDENVIHAGRLYAAFLAMFSIVVRHHLNYRMARDARYLVQDQERIVDLLCVPQHQDFSDNEEASSSHGHSATGCSSLVVSELPVAY